ncbi:hypothetical protein [Actinoallomurus soli]|uniref:hypothetical protein n=1 Tax=Actinoallomurus soli TaxID=2952535 RepID=UPI002093F3D9|nr:hypothetical protein [Actinoallomurus soli]MCO5974851.1 hypothetical protein [Actinoallomurus soli]
MVTTSSAGKALHLRAGESVEHALLGVNVSGENAGTIREVHDAVTGVSADALDAPATQNAAAEATMPVMTPASSDDEVLQGFLLDDDAGIALRDLTGRFGR